MFLLSIKSVEREESPGREGLGVFIYSKYPYLRGDHCRNGQYCEGGVNNFRTSFDVGSGTELPDGFTGALTVEDGTSSGS